MVAIEVNHIVFPNHVTCEWGATCEFEICVKIAKSTTTYDSLKRDYEHKSLLCIQVFEWFKRLKGGYARF